MVLRTLTAGTISGTGTLTVKSGVIGGVLITTNNSDAAVVTLRRDTSTGKEIFDISTITSLWAAAPITTESTDTIYYSISGTGASAQIYEWLD